MNSHFNGHSTLVNLKKIQQTKVLMVGLGSVGSWALLNLVKMGINNIKAYDFDTIEKHNFANQVFSDKDIGKNKANVMQSMIADYFPNEDHKILCFPDKFEGGITKQHIVCAIADTMTTRKILWKTAQESLSVKLFLDVRIAGAYLQCISIDMNNDNDVEWMNDPDWDLMFDDSEMEPVKCTEKGIIYSAQMGALHYANAIGMWANENINEYPRWIEYDLGWSHSPKFLWRQ
ncbi:MAG: hypothetical protein DRN27_05355 [Thermoplasmata archaeon]|nr:MAG: hypothetical protein DRN27_05355 [Thermoplasmata archaeon]